MQNPLENLTNEQLLALLEKETKRRAKAEKKAEKVVFKKEQQILQKDRRISDLEFQLAQYKRIVHGQKRERFEGNKDQMSLPFEMEPETAQK